MTSLARQLRSWQYRELAYSSAVAVGVAVAVAAAGLAVACAIDYVIDLSVDTPFWVRVVLVVVQLGLNVLAVAGLLLAVRRFLPSLDTLAGRAEAKLPKFGHRLVTSLQLTRPTARTAGMSPDLIAQVSEEAETMARAERLSRLADPRRLWWAAGLVAAPLLAFGLAFLIFPATTEALLLRQCLLDADIPRAVAVESASPEVWPSGEDVVLTFRVTGPVSESTRGRVRARVPGRPDEVAEAAFDQRDDTDAALFTAKFPGFIEDFEFQASVRDGRTRRPVPMRVVARPVVTKVSAWVRLPAYVDPAGVKRFERIAPEGEVAAHADCAVRVVAAFSKPVATATVAVYGRDEPGGPERVVATVPVALDADRTGGQAVFDLPARPSGYAVEATDTHRLNNATPPRRGIMLLPDAPPRVELLDEVRKAPRDKGPIEDYEIRGEPLTLGGRGALVGYRARSPLGLSRAYLVYRVNEGAWTFLPLATVEADLEKVGAFVPELGLFEKYAATQAVDFYPIPSPDPEGEPGGLAAGGRFTFKTTTLTKTDPATGQTAKLEINDRVEFYVAVYDRKPGQLQPPNDRAAPGRPPGVSESRVKQVVTQAQYREWDAQRLQTQDRLKRLEDAQRGVFGQRSPEKK